MSVIGCDLSSRAVDLVVLQDDSDAATWHRFDLTGATPFERARSLRGCFPTRSWFEEQGCWLFAIEDPHSRFPHVAKALGLMTGAVAALLPWDLTVIQTTPNEWKGIFCGKPSADKHAVRFLATMTLLNVGGDDDRFKDWPQDAYDAYGIAWAVRQLNQQALDAA